MRTLLGSLLVLVVACGGGGNSVPDAHGFQDGAVVHIDGPATDGPATDGPATIDAPLTVDAPPTPMPPRWGPRHRSPRCAPPPMARSASS